MGLGMTESCITGIDINQSVVSVVIPTRQLSRSGTLHTELDSQCAIVEVRFCLSLYCLSTETTLPVESTVNLSCDSCLLGMIFGDFDCDERWIKHSTIVTIFLIISFCCFCFAALSDCSVHFLRHNLTCVEVKLIHVVVLRAFSFYLESRESRLLRKQPCQPT